MPSSGVRLVFAWVCLGLLTLAAAAQQPPAVSPPAVQPAPTPLPARSTVYRTERSDAIYDYRVNAAIVRHMVDGLVMAATGNENVANAWGSLVSPHDVVGIKVAVAGAPLFSTHPAVVAAIVDGLHQAGIPAERIVIWDRDADSLSRAGYYSRGAGYRLAWSENNYDPQVAISSPVAGRLIFGDLLFTGRNWVNRSDDKTKDRIQIANVSNQSHVSKILTQTVTKVINVPVLADNIYCGLSGSLYNMTVQNVDNWRRLVERGDNGLSIPEIYADPRVGEKVVFTLMDGLVGLYAGGPFGNTNYAYQVGRLYAGKDPVAIDALAMRQLDQWRLGARMNPVSKTALYVAAATNYQLGNSELEKIDVRDVH